MKAFDTYLQRHAQVKNLLQIQKLRVLKIYQEKGVSIEVGEKLKISPMTVINYTNGKIGDGYLAEAILSELKKIK